jgi:hypothetical protein
MAKKLKPKSNGQTSIKGGPFLSAAVLCEKILRETSDVSSLIRIVDTFTIEGPTKDFPPGLLDVNIFVCFKSGDANGKKTLRLDLTIPSGKRRRLGSQDVTFDASKGPQGGVTAHIPTLMRLAEEGIYVIDIRLDNKRFTRLPFRVRYRQTPTPET